jgi:predicted PilT family ATPase
MLPLLGVLLTTSFNNNDKCTDGVVVTHFISIKDFTGVKVENSANVYIKQGDVQEVKVTSYQAVIDKLTKDVKDGIWLIDLKSDCNNFDQLDIVITVPNMDLAVANGSGTININNFENNEYLKLDIETSGDIELNSVKGLNKLEIIASDSGNVYAGQEKVYVKDLDINLEGSGNVYYKGSPNNMTIDISGSGKLICDN